MTRHATFGEQALADASAWLARLQRADVSADEGAAFGAWLTASPAHDAAYRRALEVWHEFSTCEDAVLAQLADDARRARVRQATTRRWMIGFGGFAAAAGLALAVLPAMTPQTLDRSYVTGKGQRQRVTLADGSIVDLNAETRLNVRFSGSERRIVMADGEAIFDVARDERRPFSVEAADHIVRDVGTQFDVRHRDGELTVTVARGKVEVSAPAASARRAVLLSPGQRLEVERDGAQALKAVDPQETFSWRAGRLVYRDQPLSEVVADLNRQFVQQVEIGDPELARTPITGVIVLDSPQAVVERLSLMLPIRSVPSDRGLLLLRR